MSCKPRFACSSRNLGTRSATCSCKSGWVGNGNLCLPKPRAPTKSILTSDPSNSISQTRTYGKIKGEVFEAANPVKKYSGGYSALSSLTSKLNDLKSDQRAKLSTAPQVMVTIEASAW